MGSPMALLEDEEPGTGQRAGERRLSWPVFLLTLAAVTSSSLSALSLYQLVALKAEVEGLKSEVWRRREDAQGVKHGSQVRSSWSLKTTVIIILPVFIVILRAFLCLFRMTIWVAGEAAKSPFNSLSLNMLSQ